MSTGEGQALGPLPGPPVSLTDQTVAAIRAAVRDGTLRPGQLYSAYQIASMLGVSRSPVREALMRLAEAGTVTFERNRGFRVVMPSAKDITEIFQLRLLLEVPAARHAALHPTPGLVTALRAELRDMRKAARAHDEALFMRHDQLLHHLILVTTGNDRMVALVDSLRDVTRMLGASTVDTSRDLPDIAAEHGPIIDAVAARDAPAAAESMSHHITHTGRLLVTQASPTPDSTATTAEFHPLPDLG
ncbi:MAG TPA: GntR family transcriptional regulator [Streptosporangiaceae bacterium]|jgi:DNA-binding GntR family transcriptional regulator